MSFDQENTSPQQPQSVIRIPEDATPVDDADEEVFLLYTQLATLKPEDGDTGAPFRGLGFLDSTQDSMTMRFEVKPPPALSAAPVPAEKVSGRSRKAKGKGKARKDETRVLEIELAQDATALRSRSGDTGSVLWRASMDFAQLVLEQHHFPRASALFDPALLCTAHILELGAGTGLLSLVLGPLVRRYTATDIPALVPLLRKNIAHAPASASTSACALDWTLAPARQLPDAVLADPPDVLLAVDCIYHPALVRPLVDTFAALARPRHTRVLVVSELRAEDVVREFLEAWMGREDDGWRIWSLCGAGMGARYGVWVGWREADAVARFEDAVFNSV